MTKAIKFINAIYAKYFYLFWLVFLVIFIRYSFLSLFGALDSSLDMQWYPARHFWDSINPYLANLNGDKFMANDPNYMPLMYFVMFPFAGLEWESAKLAFWLMNIVLFGGIIALCLYLKNDIFVWFMSCFAIIGYCYGNVIGNAQIAIFIGFFTLSAFAFRENRLVLTLCLCAISIKHSFALPIMLGFFLCGYKKEVVFACVVAFIFVCIFAFRVDSSPFAILKLMSQVNAMYYSPASLGGPSDIFSLSQKIFHTPYSVLNIANVLIYASFIACCRIYTLKHSSIISASVVLALFSLPHLGYDAIMLFIAIIIAVNGIKITSFANIILCTIAVLLWRGERFIKPLNDNLLALIGGGQNASIQTHWAMNMGVLFCVVFVVAFMVGFYALLLSKDSRKER